MIAGNTIWLEIAGLGIILHSPEATAHIAEGTDYLQSSYLTPEQVQSHIQKGDIVGFCTGSPGTYILRFHSGYPDEDYIDQCEFQLRLGLHCRGGVVCVRDLYELMDWHQDCPDSQNLQLEDGYYHVTLCSNPPVSGLLGDNQQIDVYLQPLESFPKLADVGIPQLC